MGASVTPRWAGVRRVGLASLVSCLCALVSIHSAEGAVASSSALFTVSGCAGLDFSPLWACIAIQALLYFVPVL